MFPNLLKMVQVEHLRLLRIRLCDCMIGLLVPPNGAHAPQLPSRAQPVQNPNHLNQQSLSKLSEGLTGPIGLMEDPKEMLIRSLIE